LRTSNRKSKTCGTSRISRERNTKPKRTSCNVTPSTLYRMLGIVAETLSAINGETAPATMRYDGGLADGVCIDEASMLDMPPLLLAGSIFK
jgi:hypothetical protein